MLTHKDLQKRACVAAWKHCESARPSRPNTSGRLTRGLTLARATPPEILASFLNMEGRTLVISANDSTKEEAQEPESLSERRGRGQRGNTLMLIRRTRL